MTNTNNNATPEQIEELEMRRARFREEVSHAVHTLMVASGVKRSDLAAKLGRSRPFVSKILNGSHNFSLNTIADVFSALGRAPHLTLGVDLSELRYAVDEAKAQPTPLVTYASVIRNYHSGSATQQTTASIAKTLNAIDNNLVAGVTFHSLLGIAQVVGLGAIAVSVGCSVSKANENYGMAA